MKRFLILFVIVSFAKYADGQNQNAISENAIWITGYQINDLPGRLYLRKTQGDTIINGLTYIKLYEMEVIQSDNHYYRQISQLQYICSFRNDNNLKAYIIPKNGSIEHLWYDFNLSIGDTLPLNPTWYSTSFLSGQNDAIIVANIDSVEYCNAYHKRYIFNDICFPKVVQGIGFTGDLINYNYPYFEGSAWLNDFISDTLMTNCSIIVTGLENVNPVNPTINIYQDKTSINFVIINSTSDVIVNVFSIQGQRIKTINVKNGLTSFDMQELSSGIYIFKVESEKEILTKKIIKE